MSSESQQPTDVQYKQTCFFSLRVPEVCWADLCPLLAPLRESRFSQAHFISTPRTGRCWKWVIFGSWTGLRGGRWRKGNRLFHPVGPTEKGSTAREKSLKWGGGGGGAREIGTNCNHRIRLLHLWKQKRGGGGAHVSIGATRIGLERSEFKYCLHLLDLLWRIFPLLKSRRLQ